MACDKVKAWLSQAGVAFVAYNVEEDGVAYDALLAAGYRTVPLTKIGDRFVKGFAPDALAAALSARRAPGDPAAP